MDRPDERAVVAACLIVGALTLLIAPALGYDAWAWMVWARELTQLSLDTAGGPSWKPLPVLISAPFAWLDGLAPVVWLALVRGAALYSLWLAARCSARLAGAPAAATAAAFAALALLFSTDLPRTALYGSSEPLLVALLLGALLLWLSADPLRALALIALAGLIRPELWLLGLIIGLALAHTLPARRPQLALLVVAPPLIWMLLDWAGSGGLAQGAQTAQSTTPTSAARAALPALEVLSRFADSVILPVLVLALVALVFAWRRRDREVLLLAALVICWVATVAVMAQFGFTGARRYLVGPAALSCVIAGVGAGWLIASLAAGWLRLAAGGAIAALLVGFGLFVLRTDARLLSVARLSAKQLNQLDGAISAAGGRDAVGAVGPPAINPYAQTALAWKLQLPLSAVQGSWASTAAKPNWQAPAVVFVAPARLAGPKPAFSPGSKLKELARSGRWQVFRAYR